MSEVHPPHGWAGTLVSEELSNDSRHRGGPGGYPGACPIVGGIYHRRREMRCELLLYEISRLVRVFRFTVARRLGHRYMTPEALHGAGWRWHHYHRLGWDRLGRLQAGIDNHRPGPMLQGGMRSGPRLGRRRCRRLRWRQDDGCGLALWRTKPLGRTRSWRGHRSSSRRRQAVPDRSPQNVDEDQLNDDDRNPKQTLPRHSHSP